MKCSFRIQWSDEDEAFVATSAEFPGLSAFGETYQEALHEAETALELMIETYQASGIPLAGSHGKVDYERSESQSPAYAGLRHL